MRRRYADYWTVETPKPQAATGDETPDQQSDTDGRYGDEADEGWEGMLTQYGRVLKKEEDERRRIAQKPGGIDHDSI
ncbi:hypothetical protein FSOLCH5_007715 [Fusarium solani]